MIWLVCGNMEITTFIRAVYQLIHKQIFNRKLLNERLGNFKLDQIPNFDEKLKILTNWKHSLEDNEFKKTKEESLQGSFLIDFFRNVLGYQDQIGNDEWNLIQESKSSTDSSKADGVLGYFTRNKHDVQVIIELKDAKTHLDSKQRGRKNQQTPVEQAFSYASKQGKNCKWVIVSNFKEIRFYRSSTQSEYERFDIIELTDVEEFKRFYYLLCKEHLIDSEKDSKTDEFYDTNDAEKEEISDKFYKEYKQTRLNVFEHLKTHNPLVDELVLFEKTQKLMDRFIFVCFCEDTGLLPENTFRRVIEAAKLSYVVTDTPIWEQLKNLFLSIDKGNQRNNINKFNGGLFKYDEVLDSLNIQDSIFIEFTRISNNNFNSDLDVNILGHIFEQSISDIEEMKQEIRGEKIGKNGKRKKDGIFYTPEYITRFIVEDAIGGWLSAKRKELGEENLPELIDIDEWYNTKLKEREAEYNRKLDAIEKRKLKSSAKSVRTAAENKWLNFWLAYRDVLSNIKVLDPACGSGAFLNQAFDYLYKEGMIVNEAITGVGQLTLFDLNKHILKNNLFGVDLNKESVEITKLSLWLKTASAKDELTTLDKNIQCGNSLIDNASPALKPFDWSESFKDIMDNGGFDVIIGNPPYVRNEFIGHYKPFLEKNYTVFSGSADLYTYFLEKSLNLLKEKEGRLSLIFPNKFMKARYGKPLRGFLLNYQILKLIDFGDLPIFQDAVTYPLILSMKKASPKKAYDIKACDVKEKNVTNLDEYLEENSFPIKSNKLDDGFWYIGNTESTSIFEKIKKQGTSLSKWLGKDIYGGIKTGYNTAYIIDEEKKMELINDDPKAADIIHPFTMGTDIRQYLVADKDRFIILVEKGIDISNYPSILNHLNQYKEPLSNRSDIKGKGEWYELRACSYYEEYKKVKIIFPDIAPIPRFSLDTVGRYIDMTGFFIPSDSKYLLGLLNSELLFYYMFATGAAIRGGYLRFKRQYLNDFPVKTPKSAEKLRIENLANQLLELNTSLYNEQHSFLDYLKEMKGLEKPSKKLDKFFNLSYKEFIGELNKKKVKLTEVEAFDFKPVFEKKKEKIILTQQQIKAVQCEIDKEVYTLYNLNDNEIAVIKKQIAN
ncbi:N-6 DNA methylase [Bacillus sp. MYb209]|nr:N-6 DNA methylase [Bacillus sp. MYb209]